MSDDASKPKGPPPRPHQIWSFDHRNGWGRVNDPAPSEPDEHGDAALRRAGFTQLQEWPHSDAGLWTELYERETPGGAEWLIGVSTAFTWHPVLVRDLPSLLGLLGQLLPVLEAGGRLDLLNEKHEQELERRRKERTPTRFFGADAPKAAR